MFWGLFWWKLFGRGGLLIYFEGWSLGWWWVLLYFYWWVGLVPPLPNKFYWNSPCWFQPPEGKVIVSWNKVICFSDWSQWYYTHCWLLIFSLMYCLNAAILKVIEILLQAITRKTHSDLEIYGYTCSNVKVWKLIINFMKYTNRKF